MTMKTLRTPKSGYSDQVAKATMTVLNIYVFLSHPRNHTEHYVIVRCIITQLPLAIKWIRRIFVCPIVIYLRCLPEQFFILRITLNRKWPNSDKVNTEEFLSLLYNLR